jgi:hypothetical protein
MYNKKFRQVYGPRLPSTQFSILAILKHALIRKYLQKKYPKESPYLDTSWVAAPPPHIPEKKLNYFAIVYDGVVEEMIRVDDITAKFLLGGAELIPYKPDKIAVQKKMLYIENEFVFDPRSKTPDAESSKES